MSLIIPAAGKSTRFAGNKPKWLLTQPNGRPMLRDSLSGLNLSAVETIYITLLETHVITYFKTIDNGINQVRAMFQDIGKPVVVTILSASNSQPDTVHETILRNGITGPIFIKDVDNCFHHTIRFDANGLCYINVQRPEYRQLTRLPAKSFVIVNDAGELINICEKNMISNTVGVSGYTFMEASMFSAIYLKLCQAAIGELYTSHIIYYCMVNHPDCLFKGFEVENYKDWGTREDWLAYRENYKTYFVDFDGVLVACGGQYCPPYWGQCPPLKENIQRIRELHAKGATIIITTARPNSHYDLTMQEIRAHDIPCDKLVCGLPHTGRVLINDYAASNPYPTAEAIQLPRNGELPL